MTDPDIENPYYVGNYWLWLWKRDESGNLRAFNVLRPLWVLEERP